MMEYLKRNIDLAFSEWKNATARKPLLLRGARQVGKSSAVRELGKQFEYFLEINFENKDHAGAKKIFERHSDPRLICDELSALYEQSGYSRKTPVVSRRSTVMH